MSSFNSNKLSEIISSLLNKLLAPRLIELEKKAKEEMTNIKSVSQSFKSMNKYLEDLNKNVEEKKSNRKKNSFLYNHINIPKKHNNNNKISKLNTTMNSKKQQRTPDRSYFTHIKNTKTYFKKLNKEELIVNDLQCKSITNSKILNYQRKKSKIKRKSKSQKKKGELTSNFLFKKKKNSKPYFNNSSLNLIKRNKTSSFLNKNIAKSCKLLPHIKKKLSTSKIFKNNELELIGKQTQDDDSRILGLNTGRERNLINRKKSTIQPKKRSLSIILQKTGILYNKKRESFFEEDPQINDDELLTSFPDEINKKSVDNSDNSIIGDDYISDLDAETNIDEHSKIKENNNKLNYSLSERIEITLEHIEKYLNKEDLLRMSLINKECFKTIMIYLISKREDYIDNIKESLLLLKKNNSDIIDQNDNNNNFSLKPFECNNHTIRTINLLNNISIKNFFNNYKSNDINNKYIILIFDLFFISIGFKKDILSLGDDSNSKLNFYKNYFEKCDGEYIGPILEKEIKGKVFDNDTINTLYEYSHNFLNIISPNFFQKFSSEIGLFVFIIKNILDHVGITKDVNNKKNVIKLYLLYNARINVNNLILQRLNKINTIIINKK